MNFSVKSGNCKIKYGDISLLENLVLDIAVKLKMKQEVLS